MLKAHRLKTLLGLVITVALLAWVLRDVSAVAVLAELRAANVWLLAAMVIVATVPFLLRAFRWHVLLLPGFPNSSLGHRFAAVCIGFMTNNVLPARLGEFARAYSF
ncbi:MAG: lysylphosphatidylglycerol synthase domain-containing protein, partial [Gemmatimonadales bacterium]